jgi:sugar lactone lactonase YvrE
VTSARQQRSAEELARLPLSGGIFALNAPVAGLPEPTFAG